MPYTKINGFFDSILFLYFLTILSMSDKLGKISPDLHFFS